jgi:hypothetical protein
MGRIKADAGMQIMWDSIQDEANEVWKRNYALSASEVAKRIASDSGFR